MTDNLDPQALIANLDKLHRWTFGAEGEWSKDVAREIVEQASDLIAALTEAPADCYEPGTDQCVIRSDFTVQHNHRTPTPASTDARETLAQVLDDNSIELHAAEYGTGMFASMSVEEMADAILAAFPTLPVTRDDAKADAWDEGVRAAHERLARRVHDDGTIDQHALIKTPANPYRATSQKGDGQ